LAGKVESLEACAGNLPSISFQFSTFSALELAEGVEIVPAWLCVAGCVLRLEKAGDFFPQKNAKNDDFDASYWP